jgi:arylsulfatase A-like enzyme
VRRVALGILLAVAKTATAGPPPPGPVVLVVVVDAMRRDRLGAYGAARQASPLVDALGTAGIVFTHAYASTGIADAAIDGMLSSQRPSRARSESPSIAPILAAAGAVTAAVTTVVADEAAGRNLGFQDFATVAPSSEPPSAGGGWSGADRAAFPLLLWLQHHRRELRTQRVLLWWRQDTARLGQLPAPGFLRRFLPVPLDRGVADLPRRLLADVAFTPAEIRQLGVVHDAAVAQIDAALARVLDLLRAPEIARRLWVFVVAPFSESLGEHGSVGHGTTLYDEAVRVPFVVLPPRDGPSARRYDDPVSLLDLAPTILGVAGLPAEPGFAGRDLSPVLRGGTIPPQDVVVELPGAALNALHTRAVIDTRLQKRIDRTDGRTERYDLQHDPGELHPLEPQPTVVAP